MHKYLWIAVALVLLALGVRLAVYLAVEYAGVFAGAEYEPGLGFSGTSHFGHATYDAVRWHQDPDEPGRCPLRVHLPDGDLGAEEFASLDTLLARGWTELTRDEAMTPELEAALKRLPQFPDDDDAPRFYQRWHGGLLLSATFASGQLQAVYIGRGPNRPLGDHPGVLSVGPRRLSLPLKADEADRALGPPTFRGEGVGWW